MKKFNPLPDSFFDELKGNLKAEFLCKTCTTPLCSCSGAEQATIIFLPGERSYMERKVGKPLVGGDEYTAPICGDCAYLDEKKSCIAGIQKPWDNYSFPLQPVWQNNTLLPMFARNCAFHPSEYPLDWVEEVWTRWLFIVSYVDKRWLEYYSQVPAFNPKLVELKC